jgi:NADH-quinone oxidoreductase subunit J
MAMVETILFVILAGATAVTALLVILQRNPVASAIFLILTFFSLAGLYLLLFAQFVAAIQVLVYAGAIMVLFLFVIMLLNLEEAEKIFLRNRRQKVLGVILASVLLGMIALFFEAAFFEGGRGLFPPEKVAALGNTQAVARLLFTDFLLPFEITSVLLLVAIIGAIVLVKRES